MSSTMETSSEEAKLELFLQWLKVNGVELRGCDIKYYGSSKGFGVFSSQDRPDGILLAVPLDLAITPMRVLEDPLLGPECRTMLDEGEVDDRFLMMLFLMVERLRKNSYWKPYLDMLPNKFGNPLWFSEDELSELKGTTLHRATEVQKKILKSLFEGKVKKLVEKLLAHEDNPESYVREVRFEDFLWANSIFWARALNIPFPRSYVFPGVPEEQHETSTIGPGAPSHHVSIENLVNIESGKNPLVHDSASQVSTVASTLKGENLWVEGLVPGIDFCNHDLKAAATWEVDGTGSMTGIPFSMYLLSVGKNIFQGEKEISISYGNKGNEELLYLYGFVIKDNPDDYLMIHYPLEAVSDVPFTEAKGQLLEAQKSEMRCILPRSLLNNGFFPESSSGEANSKETDGRGCNYSWSGHRKMPSYASKLVFPEEFLSALRTIAMRENELYEVSSLLGELVAPTEEKQLSDTEVRAAIWEACGDSGAFQILVDLLNMKMVELEEGSGTEESDAELLEQDDIQKKPDTQKRYHTPSSDDYTLAYFVKFLGPAGETTGTADGLVFWLSAAYVPVARLIASRLAEIDGVASCIG